MAASRPPPYQAIVIALIIGMLLHPVANTQRFTPGMSFCVKKLLRWATSPAS